MNHKKACFQWKVEENFSPKEMKIAENVNTEQWQIILLTSFLPPIVAQLARDMIWVWEFESSLQQYNEKKNTFFSNKNSLQKHTLKESSGIQCWLIIEESLYFKLWKLVTRII